MLAIGMISPCPAFNSSSAFEFTMAYKDIVDAKDVGLSNSRVDIHVVYGK